MSYISERVAYLNGLADGINLDADEKYGKLLRGILDVLGAVSEELEMQADDVDEISATLDELTESVEDLEDVVYDDDECDGDCENCDEDCGDFLEVVCPNCGETVYFDEDMLDSEDGIICPNCNEVVDIALCDGDCDGCKEPCDLFDEEEEEK